MRLYVIEDATLNELCISWDWHSATKWAAIIYNFAIEQTYDLYRVIFPLLGFNAKVFNSLVMHPYWHICLTLNWCPDSNESLYSTIFMSTFVWLFMIENQTYCPCFQELQTHSFEVRRFVHDGHSHQHVSYKLELQDLNLRPLGFTKRATKLR